MRITYLHVRLGYKLVAQIHTGLFYEMLWMINVHVS
jgi:hypothetical protein